MRVLADHGIPVVMKVDLCSSHLILVPLTTFGYPGPVRPSSCEQQISIKN